LNSEVTLDMERLGSARLGATMVMPVLPALTSRENEILNWIAMGKRDREIGTILNCSWRTIQKHVEHILDKLNVETRGAAAAWWYDHRSQN
jgi:DNA-binding CsgD family transcriptional regulator